MSCLPKPLTNYFKKNSTEYVSEHIFPYLLGNHFATISSTLGECSSSQAFQELLRIDSFNCKFVNLKLLDNNESVFKESLLSRSCPYRHPYLLIDIQDNVGIGIQISHNLPYNLDSGLRLLPDLKGSFKWSDTQMIANRLTFIDTSEIIIEDFNVNKINKKSWYLDDKFLNDFVKNVLKKHS